MTMSDERLESLAQWLAHENPDVVVNSDGLWVYGADVNAYYDLPVAEIETVRDRVWELVCESRNAQQVRE